MSYNGSIRKHKEAIMDYSVYCSGPEFDKLPESDKRILLGCEEDYQDYRLLPSDKFSQLLSKSVEYVIASLLEARG